MSLDALDLHSKRREIEELEREQEKLLPAIEEAQQQRAAGEKRLATGRKRAQRLLALAEREGFKWLPAKGTVHRKRLTNVLALALRPQEDESVWERADGSEDDLPAISVMLPPRLSSYAEEQYDKRERKIERLKREIKKLERELTGPGKEGAS